MAIKTAKLINKFLRKQGGVGPECYPGAPGEYTKKWCLQHAKLQYTKIMNDVLHGATANLTTDGLIPTEGLYGNEFEEAINNTSYDQTAYSISTQIVSNRANFKRGYNLKYSENLTRRPVGVLKADDVLKISEEKLNTVNKVAIDLDYFSGLIEPCYCNEYVNEEITRYPFGDAQTQPDSADKTDDTAPRSGEDNNTVSGNGADNISQVSRAIPDVYGRYRIKCNLIERRTDGDVFGVCLAKDNIRLLRIMFNDVTVFERGAVVEPSLIAGVTVNAIGYRDLFTVTLHGINVSRIVTEYGGLVYAEVVEGAASGTSVAPVYKTIAGASITAVDASSGALLVTDANGDVIVDDTITITSADPANALVRTAGAALVGDSVYINDKVVNIFAASVRTVSPIMTPPIGVHHNSVGETVLITNSQVYNLHTDKAFGLLAPNPNAAFYAGNIGVSSDGATLYTVDEKALTHTTTNAPALNYNTFAYSGNDIVLIDAANGIGHVFKGTEFMRRIQFGAAIVPHISGPRFSKGAINIVRLSDNRILTTDLQTGDVRDTGVSAPVSLTRYVDFGNTIVGETTGGDVVYVSIPDANTATTFDNMVTAASDGVFSGTADVLYGHLLSDPERSYLDYLTTDFANAYNRYTTNYGGAGVLSTSDNANQPVLELTRDTVTKPIVVASDATAIVEAVTFSNVRTDYSVRDIDTAPVSDTNPLSDFATTAMVSDDATAAALAAAYANRGRTVVNMSTTTAAPFRNIQVGAGGNVDKYVFSPDGTAYELESEKLGVDVSYTLTAPTPTPSLTTDIKTILPGMATGALIVPHETICKYDDNLLVGKVITQLPTQHVWRLQQHYDTFIEVDFLTAPTSLPTTVTYEQLLADEKLNTACIGGIEWIQFQTVTVVSPTRIRLDGIMRGRFGTTPRETRAQAGDVIVFYNSISCKDAVNVNAPTLEVPAIHITDVVHNFDASVNYFQISEAELKYWMRLVAAGRIIDIRDVLKERFYADGYNVYTDKQYEPTYYDVPNRVQEISAAANDAFPADADVQLFLLNRGTKFTSGWWLPYKKYDNTHISYTSLHDTGNVRGVIKLNNRVLVDETFQFGVRTLVDTSLLGDTYTDAWVVTPDFNPLTETLDIAIHQLPNRR